MGSSMEIEHAPESWLSAAAVWWLDWDWDQQRKTRKKKEVH